MKIATWNVNSLRVRLEQVLNWLEREQPDVLCLQETKLTDEQFPVDKFRQAGWHCVYAGQKTYNGVAIISRHAPSAVIERMDDNPDPQKRFLGVRYGELLVCSVYIPNGEHPESDKFQYKMNWLDRLKRFLAPIAHYPVIIAGDFNIAPEDRDVYDPIAWKDRILCTPQERTAFQSLLNLGFSDAFRLFEQQPEQYTWWDYRTRAFSRNRGLRIDHILVSDSLKTRCQSCWIDTLPRHAERPSDHTPVILTLSDQ